MKKLLADVVFFIVKFSKRVFMIPDGTCRFNPTCSQYTKEAIEKLPLYKAIPKIIRRVSRCHPRGDFGYDPVIPDNDSEENR